MYRCACTCLCKPQTSLVQITPNDSYILEHGNEKESPDPKYNFNAYMTMEVNHEGSELPTPMVGLALRSSLNLPGSKSPDYSRRLVTSATYWNMGMRKSLLIPNTFLTPM